MSEREPSQKDSRLKPTSAVLDEMHRGDIHGAFGTIRLSDVAPRRTWRRRILTLLAIVGPGLIVMVGDNDAGGVSTYAQAGQDFGYSLLWTLLLLIPVLIVNQEMVVRLGAVTGVGYARLISERFGRSWGWFSAGGIFLLNFLTISTEFMGVSLAGEYFGLQPVIVVPIAAAVLVLITVSGNFRRWERAMFVFLFASLLVLPLLVLSHPSGDGVLKGFVTPGVEGGLTSNSALLIVTLATSYAFGDMFGLRHSLHRGVRDAKLFYTSYTGMVAVAAAIVLIPYAPLGLITTAVQAMAGVMLPSTTVFAVLLCNDRDVLGPWVNRRWLNAVAGVIVGAMLVLSAILVISTAIPSVDVPTLLVVLGSVAAAALLAGMVWSWFTSRGAPAPPRFSREERANWRMPALALLERPAWSRGRRIAIGALAGYLVLSIVMLAVKAVQLGMR